jgi:hypothetical protein
VNIEKIFEILGIQFSADIILTVYSSCPAISKTCKKCGLVGHFAVCCHTKAPKKLSNGKHLSNGAYQVEEAKTCLHLGLIP